MESHFLPDLLVVDQHVIWQQFPITIMVVFPSQLTNSGSGNHHVGLKLGSVLHVKEPPIRKTNSTGVIKN